MKKNMHHTIARLLLIWTILDEALALRPWRREEVNQDFQFRIKDLEERHAPLTIHCNLSSTSIISRNRVIFSHNYPLPRDPFLVDLGFQSSVMVVVLRTNFSPEVMAVKEFFTGQPTEGHILVTFLRSLQPNRLIVLIGRPNFLKFLSKDEERFLTDLGSYFVSEMDEAASWMMAVLTSSSETDNQVVELYSDVHPSRKKNYADQHTKLVSEYLNQIEALVVGEKGKMYSSKTLGELFLKSSGNPLKFGSASMHLFVPITEGTTSCALHASAHKKQQSQFCQTYEGYGRLCSCQDTYYPGEETGSRSIEMREEVPIVIVTANKPQTLFRLLRNLDVVHGSRQTKKLIIVDGFREETLALGNLFGIGVRVHMPQGSPGENTRTNMNIGFSLWAAFDHFHDAQKIILLEDDLLLSPDLLSYFHETSALLDLDESLSHVNAFGQNSFPHTAVDLTTILRAEMYPQYGWMTTKRWTQHAFRNWVREGKNIDWDWWLFNEGPKMGFEAVVPEVSRTGHVGSSGAHVTGYDQFQKFHSRIMSDWRGTKPEILHLDKIVPSKRYDSWMEEEIKNAQKLNMKVHPCIEEIFPENKAGPFVLYLGVNSREDVHESFYLLQACLGTDAIDVKEIYNGVMRFNVLSYFDKKNSTLFSKSASRKILYLVGCPLSKYCKFSEKFVDWLTPSENILEIAYEIATRRRSEGIKHVYSYRIGKKKAHLKARPIEGTT